MTKLEDIVARYYAAFNARDLEAYASLFSPDAQIIAPGVSGQGLDAMRAFDRGWCDAFPEARIENLRMTTAADHVAAGNWIHGGPQRGVLHTPGGAIPATGKTLSAPYCTTFRIEGDRINLQHLLFEPSWIPIQLGLTGSRS